MSALLCNLFVDTMSALLCDLFVDTVSVPLYNLSVDTMSSSGSSDRTIRKVML